jgi:radical SAM protein with 4Fe4S-binding SPASM domain
MSPHRENVEHLEEVVKLAVDLGAGSVNLNPVTCTGRGAAMHARGQALDFEELLELAHFVRGDLQRRTPIRLIWNTPLTLYTVGELVHRGNDGMCHVRHILGILGSGKMALCGIGQTIPDLCFGSLEETSVTEVWFDHPTLRRLRDELEAKYPGICSRCIHTRRCLTYCVAQNYQNTGRLVAPNWQCAAAHERGLFPNSRLREMTHSALRPRPPGPVAIHASAVRTAAGDALIFLGPSGTGKSTMCHLLEAYTETIALDAVHLIPRDNMWQVVRGDGRAHGRSLSKEEATAATGAPLRAILRLYQAQEPRLDSLDTLQTCRHLTDALFEIVRHREENLQTKQRAFSNLARVARSVPGYRFYFDLSERALEILNNEFNLW